VHLSNGTLPASLSPENSAWSAAGIVLVSLMRKKRLIAVCKHPLMPVVLLFLVCAQPTSFDSTMRLLIKAYKQNRSELRHVLSEFAMQFVAIAGKPGARRIMLSLRMAYVLPSLTLDLAIHHFPEEVMPLLFSLLHGNLRAVVRELEGVENTNLIGHLISQLSPGTPVVRSQVAHLLALLCTSMNFGGDTQFLRQISSFIGWGSVMRSAHSDSRNSPFIPRQNELMACISIAVISWNPTHFSAADISWLMELNPNFVVLMLHILDNSWSLVENIVSDWLGVPKLHLNNGNQLLQHIRSQTSLESVTRASLNHAEGNPMLILKLARDGAYQKLGLDISIWMFEHITQVEVAQIPHIDLLNFYLGWYELR
jgi:hypothetical protein